MHWAIESCECGKGHLKSKATNGRSHWPPRPYQQALKQCMWRSRVHGWCCPPQSSHPASRGGCTAKGLRRNKQTQRTENVTHRDRARKSYIPLHDSMSACPINRIYIHPETPANHQSLEAGIWGRSMPWGGGGGGGLGVGCEESVCM